MTLTIKYDGGYAYSANISEYRLLSLVARYINSKEKNLQILISKW